MQQDHKVQLVLLVQVLQDPRERLGQQALQVDLQVQQDQLVQQVQVDRQVKLVFVEQLVLQVPLVQLQLFLVQLGQQVRLVRHQM